MSKKLQDENGRVLLTPGQSLGRKSDRKVDLGGEEICKRLNEITRRRIEQATDGLRKQINKMEHESGPGFEVKRIRFEMEPRRVHRNRRGRSFGRADRRGSRLYGRNFTNEGNNALGAGGINVKGSVFLRNSWVVGRVGLPDAQIGGDLDCTGGTFTNEGNYALDADRINVKGCVFLRNSQVVGSVRLLGAQIGGNVECDGGTFTNPNSYAISADGARISGAFFLRVDKDSQGEQVPFIASGAVSLIGATIDGQVDCSGGEFSNPEGNAINAERAVIKGTVFMGNDFCAEGWLTWEGAQIGGELNLEGGNFEHATLDLTDSSAATLSDSGLNDPPDTNPTLWPPGDTEDEQGNAVTHFFSRVILRKSTKQPAGEKHYLLLDGFVYGRISSEGEINVDRRVEWLARQPQTPFHPRPYLQLAKVLRESGNDKGSTKVLIEMEDRIRKHNFFGTATRPLLRWTIGYGYDPLRAFWWAAGLSALGWIIYRRSYLAGGIVPTDKDACPTFKGKAPTGKDASTDFKGPERKLPPQYPSFSPLIYSVENSLPLVKLGQGDKWEPDPEPEYTAEETLAPPTLGHRGQWWRRVAHYVSPNWPPPDTGAVPESQAISVGAGEAAAVAPAKAPDPPTRTTVPGRIERALISVGLRPATDPSHVPSFLSRFATSPRFVAWFLWIQILLGWLLATLFVAGVGGVVHKQ